MGEFETTLDKAGDDPRKAREAAAARAFPISSARWSRRARGRRGRARRGRQGRLRVAARARKQGPLVVVAPDEAAADELERDVRFFLGPDPKEGAPRVLRLPADEMLPYDDLSPDRLIVQQRLGALFHLHIGTRFDVLVLSGRALARKVLPEGDDGRAICSSPR